MKRWLVAGTDVCQLGRERGGECGSELYRVADLAVVLGLVVQHGFGLGLLLAEQFVQGSLQLRRLFSSGCHLFPLGLQQSLECIALCAERRVVADCLVARLGCDLDLCSIGLVPRSCCLSSSRWATFLFSNMVISGSPPAICLSALMDWVSSAIRSRMESAPGVMGSLLAGFEVSGGPVGDPGTGAAAMAKGAAFPAVTLEYSCLTKSAKVFPPCC